MNIEKLRKICLALPHSEEDVKWGSDLCFCIAGKMFCVTNLEAAEFSATFKVRDDEFEQMLERDGIEPAPYVSRYKWVAVLQGEVLTEPEWKHFVKQSYELVKAKLPKKALAGFD